jgi:recombination protein RecA
MVESSLVKELAYIDKTFGKGTVTTLEDTKFVDVPIIPTGIVSLDLVLGTKGIPRGRIIEIYGPNSSGKSTLAMGFVAEAQKLGLKTAYIDAECSLDVEYATRLGIMKDMLYTQPDCGEDALEIAEALVRSSEVGLIIIDSVAALTPRAELEGNMGDAQMGGQARLMSQACRKLTALCSKTQTSIIFINQIRSKIGGYGNPEVTSGGNALKFYSTIRMEVRAQGLIKEGEVTIGSKTRVRTYKNKVAPPYRECEFDLIFGTGPCKIGDLVDTAVNYGIIIRAGAWYKYGDQDMGQG